MQLLKTYIIEDSHVIRDNLIGTLEELGPVEIVGVAEDEASALLWLAGVGHKVDLVIVDIFLKGGSGLGVLRHATELQRDAKLVVLSNYATPDMREKCLELGAHKVFDKSNDLDALLQYCGRLGSGLAVDSHPVALA